MFKRDQEYVGHDRHRAEQIDEMAENLAREAMHYWRMTVSGCFALPTATVLTVASGAMFLSGFVEKWFELLATGTERAAEGVIRSNESMRRSMSDRDERRDERHDERRNEQPQGDVPRA